MSPILTKALFLLLCIFCLNFLVYFKSAYNFYVKVFLNCFYYKSNFELLFTLIFLRKTSFSWMKLSNLLRVITGFFYWASSLWAGPDTTYKILSFLLKGRYWTFLSYSKSKLITNSFRNLLLLSSPILLIFSII